MSELTEAVDRISSWGGLEGVTLSDDLRAAITLYEKLRWLEVGYLPVLDIDELTVENCEAKIHEYAEKLALVQGGDSSILEKAKRQALDDAARRVRNFASASVREVISQMTPAFERHVEAYAEAVSQLPEDISEGSLLSAGPAAVEAWQIAQREARHLNQISNWVVHAGKAVGVSDVEKVCRILRPETAHQLGELDASDFKVDRALHAIDPLFYRAVKLGVEFEIHTLREAIQIRQELETVIPSQQLQGIMLTH